MLSPQNQKDITESLAASFLSAESNYGEGHMTDWLRYIAREKNLKEVTIDILKDSIEPPAARSMALASQMGTLRNVLRSELKKHNVSSGFITKAVLRFEISASSTDEQDIKCYPMLEDKFGKTYESKEPVGEKTAV
ncbi:MAG: hypothetical protein AAFP70_14440 [Calditrichota bacterium]